ncbi:MAG: hypothetical protein QGI45_10145 [Myxococcota bacterium]|jgi:long-chain fatty acid transport protein|nr:hypothetical protein [Myxococcota bacterium]
MKKGTIAFSLCLLMSSLAYADDTHYQDFIVGGRALGLAGAFTSLSSEPSGLYYNPAGIVDSRELRLQVSTSLYGFERGELREDFYLPVPGVEDLNIAFTELIIVPASAGFIKTFGEKDEYGQHKQAYALSVLVPSFRSNSTVSGTSNEDADDPETPLLVEEAQSYRRHVTDRTLWSGVGYARKLTPSLRLGISGFYVLRSVKDSEDVATNAMVGESDVDVFQIASNEISLVNGSVVMMGGIKYLPTKQIALGLNLQSPSLQLHSRSSLRFTRGQSIPGCPTAVDCGVEDVFDEGTQSTFEQIALDTAKSHTKYAPALRVGASYTEESKYTLSLDLSYHWPVNYKLIGLSEVSEELRKSLPFTNEVKREAVMNANFGGEFWVIKQVSIAGGVFSDFSSASDILREPVSQQLPKIDLLGLTMALSYVAEHSLSRLGFVYSFGAGHDVLPENDLERLIDAEQDFQRVEYVQSFFYVFLSSTFRY